MSFALLAGFSLYCILSVLVLGWAIRHSEEGYEDEQGFHRGAPPEPWAGILPTEQTTKRWDLGVDSPDRWVEYPSAVVEEIAVYH